MRVHPLPGQRLAIRIDDDTLLAVPPMDPRLPRTARVRILEYVLRRQPGLAHTTAQVEVDIIEARERSDGRLAALISETPHGTSRDHGAAA